jgi:hypothetical protein
MVITIRSAGSSRESLCVAGAALGILAVWAVLVVSDATAPVSEQLENYQINGYQALNAVEQGLFADLEIAAQDIDAFHDAHGGAWPAIAELAAAFTPPFASDAAWARRGHPTWSLATPGQSAAHVAAYAGISADASVAGSFLLFLEHRHQGVGTDTAPTEEEHFQIWYHNGPDARIPEQLAEAGLIRNGWRQIVPYRGRQELRRLNRGDSAS